MRIENIFSKSVYGIFVGVSLLVCLLFNSISYQRKDLSAYFNHPWLLLTLGVFAMTAAWLVLDSVDREPGPLFWTKMFVVAVALLLLQIFAVRNYYFDSDWDAGTIRQVSVALASHKSIEAYSGYFSFYPNNLFLVWIFSMLARIHPYCFIGFQCLICQITGLLLVSIMLNRYKNIRIALFAYIIYIAIIGISPWVVIPYSDATALIFPTLILWLYERPKYKIGWIKWALITFTAYLGYKIKPQAMIMLIAIALHIVLSHGKPRKDDLKKALSFTAGIVAAVIVVNAAVSTVPVTIDHSRSLGMPHFFMMGMNYKSGGVWNSDDPHFSMNIENPKERNEADFNVAKARIKEMGPYELAKHFCHKTLTNYNDGTFCWGGEGAFYVKMYPSKTPHVQSFLRNIYYNRDVTGKYYKYWDCFEKAIWLAVLLFSLFSIGKKDSRNNVIYYGIIGLTLFELLFEARARYLYTFVPLYIILATVGAEELFATANRRFQKQFI